MANQKQTYHKLSFKNCETCIFKNTSGTPHLYEESKNHKYKLYKKTKIKSTNYMKKA